MTEWLIIKYS